MAKRSYSEAAIPNPALQPFSVLIGEWETVGSHPMLPNMTLHGHASFEWLEGGSGINGAERVLAAIGSNRDNAIGLRVMGKNVERAIRGSLEQGLLRRPLRLEDIYYRTTLNT